MGENKAIFITGAASGIGREAALLFAKKGWFVGLYDVNEENLLSLESEIGDSNCCLKRMDVTSLEDVKASVEMFAKRTGGEMDVLLNNAGILRMGSYETIGIEDQMRIIDVNIKGVLNCIYASFELLKQTPGARIINMSSVSAMYGIPEVAVYSSTKFAIRALTEALDIEFEKHGIRVCDLMPPFVSTAMVMDAPVKATAVEKMGVKLTPDQVAAVIWKAAHGKKLHWKMGGGTKLQEFLFWAFPFLKRSIVKSLTVSSE